VGRLVTRWTSTAREALDQALRDYIDQTDIPILAEFAFQNHVDRSNLYKYEELVPTIKALVAKKEAGLERLMLSGKIPAAGCIFSLKQLGWKDNQSVELTGGVDIKVTHV
jgi:hypothetical protein